MLPGKRKAFCLLYLPLSLLYLELALKFWCFGSVSLRGLIYTTLLTGAFGTALSLACCCGRKGFARRQVTFWLTAAFLLFGAQAVYYRIFKAFLALFSITKAGGVFGDFLTQALLGIWHTAPFLLAAAVPLVCWLILGKRLCAGAEPGTAQRAWLAGAFLVMQLAAVCAVMGGEADYLSPAYLYSDTLVPTLSMETFGLVTTTRIDLRELMLTETENEISLSSLIPDAETPEPEAPRAETHSPEELLPDAEAEDAAAMNVLEIDFDRLLAEAEDEGDAALHRYFAARTPTNKNAQTGQFAGKNLIWIVAESFSSLALDETHTPTLCRLASEGFVFDNFYNPLWGVSTSDGEYVTMTGLLPKYGIWSFSRSAENAMPFSLAHLLEAQGYVSYGYHDHSYYYYDRDRSHPNMGYEWIARGSGLELTDQFPESDLEMIEGSVSDYVNQEPFHVYYLTVSGHMYYDFSDNAMALKHEADVADLPLSEGARAYIACNMELDAALAALLDALDEAGVLENTVIALSGDHYPYALSEEELEELHGGPFDDPLELYHSTFILWSGDMAEPVRVTKSCSSLDIMPTLANLFGLPYDSRLVMGRDVFSDAEPLVIFSDRSFITDRGRYIALGDSFSPALDAFRSEREQKGYVRETLSEVNDMFAMSAEVLMRDYYTLALQKPQEAAQNE